MSRKFDEFSKHLATKQTRRGALRFLGAGLIGAFVSTIFSREADATHWRGLLESPQFNQSVPVFNQDDPHRRSRGGDGDPHRR